MSRCEIPTITVKSVEEYVCRVLNDTVAWSQSLIEGCSPWFRGQSDLSSPPLPGICRSDNECIDEQGIAGRFVKLARMFGEVPDRGAYSEWLFMMQHVGIPTRLLDWSEGALIGLYFAVERPRADCDPGVWMLNPLELNRAVLKLEGPPSLQMFPEPGHPEFDARCARVFPQGHPVESPGEPDIANPIAIIPMYSHPRMKSQRGCFTLHGTGSASIEAVACAVGLVKPERSFLLRYRIPRDCTRRMLSDLRMLGVTHSTLFPDQDGLANDLKNAFREERQSRIAPRGS